MHVSCLKGIDWILCGAVGVLGVDHDLIGGAIFWAGLGFSSGGRLWRPVGVHTELLGQMHIASLGCHLA